MRSFDSYRERETLIVETTEFNDRGRSRIRKNSLGCEGVLLSRHRKISISKARQVEGVYRRCYDLLVERSLQIFDDGDSRRTRRRILVGQNQCLDQDSIERNLRKTFGPGAVRVRRQSLQRRRNRDSVALPETVSRLM